MIYGFTSKRGGCGRSTVAVLSSLIVKVARPDSSLLLMDLSYGKDLNSLLNIQDNSAGLDTLISNVFLNSKELDLKASTLNVLGFDIIPGTSTRSTRYLEKRVIEVRSIIEYLSSKYSTIILDIDYDLMIQLQAMGIDITPIHILEQNRLNYLQYRRELVEHRYEGFYVINRYRPYTFPSLDEFTHNFKQGSLFCVEYDDSIISIMNKQKITLKDLKESKVFNGINGIAKIIVNNVSIIPTQKKKKVNKAVNSLIFFFKLFSTKTTKPKELNKDSLDFLSTGHNGGIKNGN